MFTISICLQQTKLALIGGTTMKDTVRQLLKYLVTDALATSFTWKGMQGKRAFHQLRLKKIVSDHFKYFQMLWCGGGNIFWEDLQCFENDLISLEMDWIVCILTYIFITGIFSYIHAGWICLSSFLQT